MTPRAQALAAFLFGGVLVVTSCTDSKSAPDEEPAAVALLVSRPPSALVPATPVAQPLSPTPPTTPVAAASPLPDVAPDTSSYYALCNGKIASLSTLLQPIARRMMSQNIIYTQTPANEWRDCSGNFLRLSSYLASTCPEQQKFLAAKPGIRDYVEGGNNKAHQRVAWRSTRDIAKWYADKKRLFPIYYDGVVQISDRSADLVAARKLIRPGSVLWFSRSKPLEAGGIKAILSGGPGKISHMGTVVAVTRNDGGELMSYSMYHGRSAGKPGAITEEQFWEWPASYTSAGQAYPSLGFWRQYLVSVGTIVPAVPDPD